MKNIQKEGADASEKSDAAKVSKLLVLAAVGLKLGRKIYAKLESLEESIEILARDVAEQSKRRE